MFRDISTIYELCTELKEHRYINHNSDEILNEKQEKRINEYIDDLSIDLFFRLAPIKHIKIQPCIYGKRYSPTEIKNIDEEIELNLCSPYDRYTFLSILTHPQFLKSKFSNNRFITNLMSGWKQFGATGISNILHTGVGEHPYLDAFYDEYRRIDFDFNRSAALYCLRDFMRSLEKQIQYNIYAPQWFLECMSEYPLVKNVEIFQGISLEYALAIYVILVEKLEIKDNNIGSIIALGLDNSSDCFTHPFHLFHNFELKLHKLFRKEEILMKDVFLRFVNPKKSKAFVINWCCPSKDFVTIQLFKEKPIRDILSYNPLALPYLHNQLYNL